MHALQKEPLLTEEQYGATIWCQVLLCLNVTHKATERLLNWKKKYSSCRKLRGKNTGPRGNESMFVLSVLFLFVFMFSFSNISRLLVQFSWLPNMFTVMDAKWKHQMRKSFNRGHFRGSEQPWCHISHESLLTLDFKRYRCLTGAFRFYCYTTLSIVILLVITHSSVLLRCRDVAATGISLNKLENNTPRIMKVCKGSKTA